MSSSSSTRRTRRRQPRRTVRKSQLSPARRWLVEDMQRLGYGRYPRLLIRDREPVISPPPRRLRKRRLAGGAAGRPEVVLNDFALKRQILELFDEFDRIGNGIATDLMVRDGLPYDVTIEEPGAD